MSIGTAKCCDCRHYFSDQDVEVMMVFCHKGFFSGPQTPEQDQVFADAIRKNTTPCEMKDFAPRT